MQSLARVHAVERLVEHEDVGIMDQRRRNLRSLAHALRVRGDRAIGGRPARSTSSIARSAAAAGVRQPVQAGAPCTPALGPSG